MKPYLGVSEIAALCGIILALTVLFLPTSYFLPEPTISFESTCKQEK